MKIKIVAPIQYFYLWDLDSFPEKTEVEENLFLTKFDSNHVDLSTGFFTEMYSGWQERDLKNSDYCLLYEKESDNFDRDKKIGIRKAYHFVESLKVVRPNDASTLGLVFKKGKADKEWMPQSVSAWPQTIYKSAGWKPKDMDFRSDDLEAIIKYYLAFDKLYSDQDGKYHRLLNSFIFFQLAFQIRNSKLRIVPFTTALESLFNTSENEIGYSLRMRCSYFLEEKFSEREKIAEKIKLIYQVRSAVVHGSSIPKKLLKDEKLGNQLMMDVEEICRRCFQKIVDDNLVDIFEIKNKKSLAKKLDKGLLS